MIVEGINKSVYIGKVNRKFINVYCDQLGSYECNHIVGIPPPFPPLNKGGGGGAGGRTFQNLSHLGAGVPKILLERITLKGG